MMKPCDRRREYRTLKRRPRGAVRPALMKADYVGAYQKNQEDYFHL